MPGIEVCGLSKRFGPILALDEIDLTVVPGEVVALLGENGAGKSTMMRVLGTALLPDAGKVIVADHDVEREPLAARRATGFLLPDERSWYWPLTGRQNLEFFAALHGMRRRQAAARAVDLLEEVGLTDAADRPFGQYSSGMRLRLSLARALISQPLVLLLDEPTRSLDPLGTAHFHDLVADLTERRGTAVLLATHDLHEAAAASLRVFLLQRGRLSPAPDTARTASDLELAMISAQ